MPIYMELAIAILSSGVVAILFWFYKKTPSIKVSIKKSVDGICFTVRNHKDVSVKIKHVQLVRKYKLKCGFEFKCESSYGLVDSSKYDFDFTQIDDMDICLMPNSPGEELSVPYWKVFMSYDEYVPYKYSPVLREKYLDRVIMMPRCHLAIILDSGKTKFIPLSNDFYHSYKADKIKDIERELSIYAGMHPDVSLMDSNLESKREYGEWLLNKYFMAIKTFYYLLPDESSQSHLTDI